MVDNGKARFVVIAGTRNPPVTQTQNDNNRRQLTLGPGQHRHFVRRGSMDSATILRSRPIVLTRANTVYDTRDRRLAYAHTSGREAGLRKQSAATRATTVTPVKELKSILKSTRTSSTPASAPLQNQSGIQYSKNSVTESKCNYRLPENPNPNLRKSVSFREDQVGSIRRHRQQLASPAFSIPFYIKGFEKRQEFFV